jgi:hypothetical protein
VDKGLTSQPHAGAKATNLMSQRAIRFEFRNPRFTTIPDKTASILARRRQPGCAAR